MEGGASALPPTGPSSSKQSLDRGIVGLPDLPEAHNPLPPSPICLRPSYTTAHRTSGPSVPAPALPRWGSLGILVPAGFPETCPSCAASFPTPGSPACEPLTPLAQVLRSALHAGFSALLAAPGHMQGAGTANGQVCFFLYCCVALGRSLDLSEPLL